jgi:hypothetical protein
LKGWKISDIWEKSELMKILFRNKLRADENQRMVAIIRCRICCLSVWYPKIYKIMYRVYRTIIWHVVLYGCETWSLTLREERRLSVFENRVLRRIFGLTRDEVTGEWRKLHKEELNNICSSPNIVRVITSRQMGWARHVARLGESRIVYRDLMAKAEGTRTLGRPRSKWEDNINLLKPVGFSMYHQVQNSKTLHGANFALSVLYSSQNTERTLLYTSLTDWFL